MAILIPCSDGWARAAQANACTARTELLERRLSAAVDEEYEIKTLKVREQLPRVDARAIGNDRGPVLQLGREGLALDGTLLSGQSESSWRAGIAQRYDSAAAALGVEPPGWFYVVADRSTDITGYLGFLVSFGADHELRLVVEPKKNPHAGLFPDRVPPGAVRLLNRLASLEDTAANSGAKAKLFAEEFASAAGQCGSMARIYDLGKTPMPERSRKFVKTVVENVRECGCDSLDIDAFEYVALRMYAAFQYPRRILRVRFSSDTGVPLRLGRGPITAQRFAESISTVSSLDSQGVIRLRPPTR
jgi:hypothetical protein